MFIILAGLVIFWFYFQVSKKTIYPPNKQINETNNNFLSIITYNIQKLPWAIKSVTPLRALLDSYDIILLQECFMVPIQTLASLFPNHWVCKGFLSGLKFKLLNSGLVILSKYQIVDARFYPFNNSNIWTSDYLCEKGLLVIRILVNGKYFYIGNTHLQSSHYKSYDGITIKQFAELERHIQKQFQNDKYIFAGDFNIDPQDLVQHIGQTNIIAPQSPSIYIDFTTGNSQSYPLDSYSPFVYDYFITNIKIEEPEIINTLYSDHLPVHTKVDLN